MSSKVRDFGLDGVQSCEGNKSRNLGQNKGDTSKEILPPTHLLWAAKFKAVCVGTILFGRGGVK